MKDGGKEEQRKRDKSSKYRSRERRDRLSG